MQCSIYCERISIMENKQEQGQQQETQAPHTPVTLNVTEVPSAPKKVRKSPSPPPRINVSDALRLSLVAGIACIAPSIPAETMNMVYGGAAACVMSSSSSSSSSRHVPHARGGYVADYSSDDDSSDDDSVTDIDEDSNPSRGARIPVDYNQRQKDDMEDESVIFKTQIRLMKRSSRYVSYENQTSTAVDICNMFNNLSVVIQMVIGYTQSGKTGCMVELIDQMTKNTDKPISTQNIFVITGLSSTEWKKQTIERFPECMKVHIFHNGELEKFKTAVAGKQNVLVIVDEAHMASKKEQTMTRIFKELNWKLDYMMENDIKLVQFSATPDGLVFALKCSKWPKHHYSITRIKPGRGYFGAKQMNEREQLKQIKNIYGRSSKNGKWINDEVREHCLANISEILCDQLSFQEPRYLVVRIRGGKQEESYHKNFSEAIELLPQYDQEMFDRTYLHYNMRGNVDNISEQFSRRPEKHTIVFIKEKMKCAQTLEYVFLDEKTGTTTTHKVKHNIGVVVERLTKNDSFTIQGLLGRLCGYEEHDCICYTNLESFKKYEELFASNFDTGTLKRVSWNSNTTQGNVRGTSVIPTVNDYCLNGEYENNDSQKTKREYDTKWFAVTPDTWDVEWSNYCAENGVDNPSRFENPFDNATDNMSPSGLWCGQHRGWKVLKFIDGKLFECNDDEAITPVRELPVGSTGSDKLRKYVCYNSENQLGVCIARCVGKEAC